MALTALGAALTLGIILMVQPDYSAVRAGKADAGYLPSSTCLPCHPQHHASWAQTFHRRMTQEAKPSSVQGDFTQQNRYTYLGVAAHMQRRGDDFLMHLAFADGRNQTFPILRTVGSRRVEQYLTQVQGRYLRLPLAYDLIERRWFSLNGAFLRPDGNNYFQHVAKWDANCVFCHNVKAQPHLQEGRAESSLTEVAELGIACGACHGAAAEHITAAASPWIRAFWRLWPAADRHIVQPAKLSKERSLMVCGHCHGQRLPEPVERVRQVLGDGDPYNAGDDLSVYYRPIAAQTRIGQVDFGSRFWADGSPRLTAYEYQGVLHSPCYQKAGMDCLHCHSMHDGSPEGQMRAENRGDRPCLSCHVRYANQTALSAHTKHPPNSTGSRCYGCHMPRVVYGVLSIHPTHQISVPNPELTATHGVPNACNQCHLERSVRWAISTSQRLWPQRYPAPSNRAAEKALDAAFDTPEGARALFAGDALLRALTAEALGGGGKVAPAPQWAAPLLIAALDDDYPAVRRFAAQGLRRLLSASSAQGESPKFDFLAPLAERAAVQQAFWAPYSDVRATVENLAQTLRQTRVNRDIEVGE